ncbi:MAG: nucleotidyltransferase family protein [Saprospiraceae bacterium]|nr:nucleotidyltransferase family protein [Saprospiraceae bacterium]
MQQLKNIQSPALTHFLERLGELKEEIRLRYKVTILGIFGSYARLEHNKDSDLDILVHVEKGATLFDLIELEYFLQDRLGVKPDIVTDNSIKPRIKPHIFNDLVII